MTPLSRFRAYLANLLAPPDSQFVIPDSSSPTANSHQLSAVSSTVDDSPGWTSLSSRLAAGFAAHDYDPSRIHDLYNDALTAWRKNPLAQAVMLFDSPHLSAS